MLPRLNKLRHKLRVSKIGIIGLTFLFFLYPKRELPLKRESTSTKWLFPRRKLIPLGSPIELNVSTLGPRGRFKVGSILP